MQFTEEFWEQNCHKSGEQIAREQGMDGGNVRRAIRTAKQNPNLRDLPWFIPVVDDVTEELDYDLTDLGLIPPPKDGPPILLYDIETAPGLAWVWGAYDQNAIAMEQDWYMLSFAYKWLNGDGLGFVSIFQDEAFTPDTTNDRFVAERLAALFDRADVIVAHNGEKFDRKKANQRFLVWGIDPPSPYQSIDTLRLVKTQFSHFSNALKELGRVHGLGDKEHHTGFELWRECMRGDAKFWGVMEKYNRQDVVLLERVYLKLLPWMSLPGKASTVNYGFWAESGKMVCPNCGHDKLTKRGTHRTLVSEFPTYKCDRCRTYSRFRKREPQINGGVQLV